MYVVNAKLTISVMTRVEATSAEEAKDIADSYCVQTLCHQCSGGNPDVEWTVGGDLDGVPYDLHIEPRS